MAETFAEYRDRRVYNNLYDAAILPYFFLAASKSATPASFTKKLVNDKKDLSETFIYVFVFSHWGNF